MTKKELEEEIKRLNKLINTLSDENAELTKQLNNKEESMHFEDTADYKQMKDQIDFQNKELKLVNDSVQHYKKHNEKLKQAKDKLLDEVDKLHKLINDTKKEEGYNSRGAGRKERFSDNDKQEILQCKNGGYSIRAIAKKYNASTTTIQKILKQFYY